MKSSTAWAIALAITLMLCITTAWSQAPGAFFSGNELHQLVRSSKPVDRLQAQLYVAGVLDASYGVHHCAPTGVTLDQAVDLVAQTLQRTPAQRHLSAHLYVTGTMAGMWPCATKGVQL